MRAILCLIVLLFAFGAPLEAQRRCVRGKPCGNTCIAQNRTCRVDTGTAPAARGAQPSTAPASRPAAQASLPSDDLFVASSRGRVYYPRSCSAWRTLSRANLIGFKTEEEAQEAGYAPTTSYACEAGGMATATPATPVGRSGGECWISSVTDGDTVRCRDGRRIRLLLIDTPEMAQGPYGLQAKHALTALLPVGTSARVELDVEVTDRYGRILAYLYDSSGRMANEEMARLGYALQLTYPPNVQHVERIGAAVEEARMARRGLWSGSAFECSPRDHRAGQC